MAAPDNGHEQLKISFNVVAGILCPSMLATSTIILSILASRSPSRTSFYEQKMNCQLYYNQGAPKYVIDSATHRRGFHQCFSNDIIIVRLIASTDGAQTLQTGHLLVVT
eukprot:TRINITY_DN48069_c0_g1_i1.p2 TRINITY_DN48069_c0_g1~~TRINITY_DN48069_c0_g1_i1.p2  ORF type:complete len:117 (+),score=9.14 TRINITY_DN48069_c0_g1_i1:27-353(+)